MTCSFCASYLGQAPARLSPSRRASGATMRYALANCRLKRISSDLDFPPGVLIARDRWRQVLTGSLLDFFATEIHRDQLAFRGPHASAVRSPGLVCRARFLGCSNRNRLYGVVFRRYF